MAQTIEGPGEGEVFCGGFAILHTGGANATRGFQGSRLSPSRNEGRPPTQTSARQARAGLCGGKVTPRWMVQESRLATPDPASYDRSMALLEIHGLKKQFVDPDGSSHVVVDIPAFALNESEQVAMVGESGLGKTTLLHLIAGILKADSGSIRFSGEEITGLSEAQRDRWRARSLGYIFQTFNLLPAFTCLENVVLGMAFGSGVDRPAAHELLRRVGLADRLRHYPRQLSTGQQQRVAIARALANRPKLVLADEPTGNLDAAAAREVLTLIRETCRERGAALMLVSHDRDVLAQFDSVIELQNINRARPSAELTR